MLIGYNRHKIYRVFIEKQDNNIWLKDFHIFKDISKKISIFLFNFKKNLIFKGFFAINWKGNFYFESDNITMNKLVRITKVLKF